MRLRHRVLAATLVVALAACADDDTATPPSTTAPSSTGSTIPVPTTTVAPTTTVVPTTTAPVTWPSSRGWVVGTASGLVAIDENGTRSTLVDGPVVTVAVGTDGTVWFQRASILFGRTDATTAADTRVLAYDRATRTVRDAVVPAPAADGWAGALQLDGVVIVDGRVQLVLRRSMYDPAQNVELQRWDESFRRDVATGAETTGRRVAVWETGATRITIGGGLVAYTSRTEDQRRSVIVDLAGNPVSRFEGLVPMAPCADGPPGCPDALTVSPSGTRLAWVESPDAFTTEGRRHDLVVVDTVTRSRVATVALAPGNAETVIAFAGDGRVAVTRFPWPDAASTTPIVTLIDVDRSFATNVPFNGYTVPDVAR